MFFVLPIPIGFLITIVLMSLAELSYKDRTLKNQILTFTLFMLVLLIPLILIL